MNARLSALVILLGLLAATPAGLAQSPSVVPAEIPEWSQEERVLTVTPGPVGFEFTSRRSSDLDNDRIRGGFGLTDARLRYEFETVGNESVFYKNDLFFVALIEFVDRDGDRRFTLGDESIQRLELAGRDGATMLPRSPDASGAFEGVANFPLIAAEDSGLPIGGEPARGLLSIHFYLTPRATAQSGSTINPVEVRFEIVIEDFPFNRTTGSMLALETRSVSNLDLTSDPDRLSARTGRYGAFFDWSPEGSAPGADPVGVTVLQDPGTETASAQPQVTVLFTYPRQGNVQSDGRMGMTRFEDEPILAPLVDALRGDALAFVVATIASAAIVGGTAWNRVRRR